MTKVSGSIDVDSVVECLLESPEPSVRWKVQTGVLGQPPDSPVVTSLQDEIRDSERVRTLLGRGSKAGAFDLPRNVYAKWQGAHWVLSHLADIGYPPGDESLYPIRDLVQNTWLDAQFFVDFEAKSKSQVYSKRGVPVMRGHHRAHASQQGNTLWSILKLRLADDRTPMLAERLLYWQWPDGGWNCDRNPEADSSSFMETIYPMRALALFGKQTGDSPATTAAERASRIFLDRKLYLHRSDGSPIRAEFTKLHYPLYWHYDFLAGLKALAECGFINDPACEPALDMLVEMRLPDGGWPATSRYYRHSTEIKLGNDSVDWGGTSKRRMNEWVTADALAVLRAAGKLSVSLGSR